MANNYKTEIAINPKIEEEYILKNIAISIDDIRFRIQISDNDKAIERLSKSIMCLGIGYEKIKKLYYQTEN